MGEVATTRQVDPRTSVHETMDPGSATIETAAEVVDLHVSLTRDRAALPVLRGIDLEIGRGEIVGLVGESGSGKSVLGLTMLGLLPEESRPVVQGSVRVDGTDVTQASPEALRELHRHRVGAIFQDPMTSLDPTMRVGKQMLEVADSAAHVISLLKEVGVPDPVRRMNAYPHELSGGLRQRVMIAIAIAGSPRLIVADEPTTALDVTVQAQILELFARLREELACSIVLITHDLAVASQIADRIFVLYGGRIAEIGPTSELLATPRHPYTAALLRSRLADDADKRFILPTLPGEPPDLGDLPTGCPFAPRCRFREPECEQGLPPLVTKGRRRDACRRSDAIDLTVSIADRQPWSSDPRVDLDNVVVEARAVEVAAAGTGVFRRRSTVKILTGVDLTVRGGESIALVGESGCGKTTFLRAVASLVKPTGGSLVVSDPTPQMIFQDAGSSLTPWLSVGEIISDRLRDTRLSGEQRKARMLETLALVGLPEWVAGQRPGRISGGQRQRVAIARAIAVPPQILLCDEPTSALDASVAASVLNLLGQLRRKLGMALLFVTHDLGVARLVADRIAVMYLGRIVELGGADEVLTHPRHPYTESLIASIPRPGGTRAHVAGEPPSLFDPPGGCAFHPRCPSAEPSCSRRIPNLVSSGTGTHLVDCVLEERA